VYLYVEEGQYFQVKISVEMISSTLHGLGMFMAVTLAWYQCTHGKQLSHLEKTL